MSNYPTREEIERRAYEIYVECGRQDGNDVDHWLEAEQELGYSEAAVSATDAAPRHKAAAAGRHDK
jgi:pyrroloquinoline quinone (PQQ) biosynthesis protein C